MDLPSYHGIGYISFCKLYQTKTLKKTYKNIYMCDCEVILIFYFEVDEHLGFKEKEQ